MIKFTIEEFEKAAEYLAKKIKPYISNYNSIFGIPRGGIPLAIKLSQLLDLPLVQEPREWTLVVDDIMDSGRTRSKYLNNSFACIHWNLNKRNCYDQELNPSFYYQDSKGEWIEYWWEQNEAPATDSVIRMLEYIGEDPLRPGLLETPERVVKSWEELYGGYKISPESVFKVFEDEEKFGGLVYLNDVEFYSMCEHHLLPFTGKALIAYIPNGPVIGASKLARLLDVYARRCQMQERIGEQVTNALMKHLNPIGAACLLEAKHLCMACRGVKKQHSVMGYHSLKGVFLENSYEGVAARQELMTVWGK